MASMEWRVLIGYQGIIAALMVLVCRSLLLEVGKDFSHISFEVGDDSSVFFWHHNWCNVVLLRDRFPSLYALAEDRDARVSDDLEHSSSLVVWSLIFFFRDAFSDDDSVVPLFLLLLVASLGALFGSLLSL